jgi:hypothetical protein
VHDAEWRRARTQNEASNRQGFEEIPGGATALETHVGHSGPTVASVLDGYRVRGRFAATPQRSVTPTAHSQRRARYTCARARRRQASR